MHAAGHNGALADLERLHKQNLLPTVRGEDGSVLLPQGPWWPQPRRRSSLINDPLALRIADSLEQKPIFSSGVEQYCPAPSSAYGSALVSELRQDDESFFSDKSDMQVEAPTLAAALVARRSSLLISSNPSTTDSLGSARRKPVSRHVSHIGYGQQSKVLSRLRRSSNGEDDLFPLKERRRSHESATVFPVQGNSTAYLVQLEASMSTSR